MARSEPRRDEPDRIPVPPGFTITTEVCAVLRKGRKIPEDVKPQVEAAVKQMEEAVGKKFGDPPIRFSSSVRSGAALSMPGMMNTILNLGLTDASVEGLAKKTGNRGLPTTAIAASSICSARPRWASSTRRSSTRSHASRRRTGRQARHRAERRRPQGTGQALQGRLQEARRRAISRRTRRSSSGRRSWPSSTVEGKQGRRVPAHRADHRPEGNGGQRPGDGLRQHGQHSGTGVAFTRDPNTGEDEFYGEYLINAQGEDVVAGIRTPEPISRLERADAQSLRPVDADSREARNTLQRDAGHRVHRAGRHAVHAADPDRQADRHVGRSDRRRDGQGRVDRRDDRDQAGQPR